MPRKTKSSPSIVLNEEQKAVIGAREGYFKCLACPGAGKSFCLVSRFAALISEGISPDDILSLSFTRTAAKNLRDRVEAQVGKLSFRSGSGSVTFHSLALTFAEETRHAFSYALAESPLAAEPTANKFAAIAARRYELNPRDVRTQVSLWKRRGIRPASAVKDSENSLDAKQLKFALAYKEYDKHCRENGVLDFDSLLLEMTSILEKNPEIRKSWIRDFLQVDEAQDLSKTEWRLVQLLAGKSLIAVGDSSQNIYSFRASDSSLFTNMEEMFPEVQTLYLSTNFRSSPEILDFIRPLSATKELAEKLSTPNPRGPSPVIKGFLNAMDEANWIVQQLKPQEPTALPFE